MSALPQTRLHQALLVGRVAQLHDNQHQRKQIKTLPTTGCCIALHVITFDLNSDSRLKRDAVSIMQCLEVS